MIAGQHLADELDELAAQSLGRARRTIGGAQGPTVRVDGRDVLCLCSNNYLGLAGDPRLRDAAVAAIAEAGIGAGASPLVSGHMDAHERLESAIAAWQGCEAALVFGSGYHANIGVLAALVRAGDEVFSDELNHASLIDGCRLSRAQIRAYRHLDASDLERQLGASRARRRLIVTDSVFSMDGDLAPLAEIVALADRYDAWVMIDEAHAVGVFGETGAGLAEATGLGGRITVRMGTLGKALGSYGAFVAGSRALIELLVNRARAYVYSTALPPPVIAAADASVAIVRGDAERRRALWDNARRLHGGLERAGLAMRPFTSPIVPLVVGGAAEALAVAERALEQGVLAPAIRPPTVPQGTARLRLTPIAAHTAPQIDHAVGVLSRAIRETGA
ncbi:MAG: 8-amino-7-oxononanoate synthase [Deltaproteobacteria bacterium]|nr:8-amino-7-oxononanoate synthase [Deltaproteobacteria bacterium]